MGDGTEGNVIGMTGGIGGINFRGDIADKALGIFENTNMRIAITDNQVGEIVLKIAVDNGYASRVDVYMGNGYENSKYLCSKYASADSLSTFLNASEQGANIIQVVGNEEKGFLGKLGDWIEEKTGIKGKIGVKNEMSSSVKAAFAEGKVITASDEVIIFQNNNQAMTDRVISAAKESGKPTMLNRFMSSIKVSSTVLNCFGIVAGALSAFLDYQDLQNEIKYINKLLKKNPEKLTEEEINFLHDVGIDPYQYYTQNTQIDESNWKDLKIASGGHRGNPYHDRLGRFCSAADAVTVSG